MQTLHRKHEQTVADVVKNPDSLQGAPHRIIYHELLNPEASKGALAKTKPFKEDIVTPVVPAGEFWPAEDYHQDFYVKNPVRYKFYRTGCGRDARLKQLWGSVPH